jgi:hypothetical protein
MTSNIPDFPLKDGEKIDLTPRLSSDSIELMEVYIAYMRADEDFDAVPDMLNCFNDQMFIGKGMSMDQLRQLAVYAVDKIYRIADIGCSSQNARRVLILSGCGAMLYKHMVFS